MFINKDFYYSCMEKDRYITHIIPDRFPEQGFRKLSFYTRRGETYYFGKLNSCYDEKDLRALEETHRIIKLPEPIKLEENTNVWVDGKGNLYSGDISNSFSEKLRGIEGISLNRKR